jgi:ABC-type oligopeptide transport system substrate-binding subunit
MRRTAILALTTLALAACGPDDHASVSAAQATANTSLPAGAVEPLVLPAAADGQAASNSIAAARASLAADAQQVTPVMHSAPDATQ